MQRKKFFFLWLCLLSWLGSALPPRTAALRLYAVAQETGSAPSLTKLAWLGGCWENRQTDRLREEQWMKPAGGSMIGMGRSVRQGKTVEYEFMQIREVEGSLVFIAKPSGQPETSFKLVTLSDTEVVFADPQHDFPQRLIYRLLPDQSLLARIEGTLNGKQRAIDFPFKRAQCN